MPRVLVVGTEAFASRASRLCERVEMKREGGY